MSHWMESDWPEKPWPVRCCERCSQVLPKEWMYAWCKDCGETGVCHHGKLPHECNQCFIESDMAFDVARESVKTPKRSDDPEQ